MDKMSYVMQARAAGSNKEIVDLEAEWQLIFDNYNPVVVPTPNPVQDDAENVDAWLKALKQSTDEADNEKFESLRKLPLSDQHAAWVADGSPVA